MNPSRYVGRVGGLAAALGVGVAVFTAPAVAWADTDSPSGASDGTAVSNAVSNAAPTAVSNAAPERGDSPRARRSDAGTGSTVGRARSGRVSESTPDASAADAPAALPEVAAPRRNRAPMDEVPGPAATLPAPAGVSTGVSAGLSKASPATADAPEPAAATVPVAPAATIPVAPAASAALPVQVTPPPALFPKLTSLLQAKPISAPVKPTERTTPATVADRITTAVNTAVSRIVESLAEGSPFVPATESPANWLLLAFTRKQPLSAATGAAQVAAPVSPTLLVLNGYKVVAASPPVVTAFYGPYTNFPGYPGIQTEQVFNLVDPASNTAVGSFKGLAITFNAIGAARQIVVTDVLSGTAGTASGETPPVGSVIALNGAPALGTVYSAMPSGSGYVVRYDLVTPFGTVPQSTPYNAAEGLTDYVEVNKPLKLTGGYYIAPATSSSKDFTATAGQPPLFGALQGRQSYSLFDKTGAVVGGFEGLVTTTSDVLGLYTKAILVTDTGDSTNVGTDVGQVPPVGTVYNIINFTDSLYVLYASMPSPSGTVVSTKLVTPLGATEIPFPFDASAAPEFEALQVPASYKFVPTSEFIPAGVNGLPPREVIVQGYQQFDVVDALGNKIGSVDAAVTRQWDWMGGQSNAILVTNVTSGRPGVLGWNVPPEGSVFSTRTLNGLPLGFSDFYSSIPTPLGDIVISQTVTPFGLIPNFLPNNFSKDLDGATYVNPFA